MVEFTYLMFEDIYKTNLKCELPISIKVENIILFHPVCGCEEYTEIYLDHNSHYIVKESYEEVRRKLKIELKNKKKKMQFINEN